MQVRARYRKLSPNPFQSPLPTHFAHIDAEIQTEQLSQAEALARAACPDGFTFVELTEIAGEEERPFRVPCPA